jgi:hypothetical protein
MAMRRLVAIAAAAATVATALPAAAAEPRTAPDCRFDGARTYKQFGRIHTFTSASGLYACLTDVGRAHKLDTGTVRARSSATRRAVFGAGDWVGYPARDRSGRARVRAIDLRTGATHGATSPRRASALVVNWDGTLAWIAGTKLWTKRAGAPARRLASDPALDPAFLGMENDRGCAVTWRAGGEQRSSSIHCSRP